MSWILLHIICSISFVHCVEQRGQLKEINPLKLCLYIGECTPRETQYTDDPVSPRLSCVCPERDREEQQEGICFVPRCPLLSFWANLKLWTISSLLTGGISLSGSARWKDTQYLTGTLNINSVKCHTQSGACAAAFWKQIQNRLWEYFHNQIRKHYWRKVALYFFLDSVPKWTFCPHYNAALYSNTSYTSGSSLKSY